MSMDTLYYQLQMEFNNVMQELRLYRMFCGPMDMTNPSFLSRLTLGQQGISVINPNAPAALPAPPVAPPSTSNYIQNQSERGNYVPRGRGGGRGGNRGNRGGNRGRGGRWPNNRKNQQQNKNKKENFPDSVETTDGTVKPPPKFNAKQEIEALRRANAEMRQEMNSMSAKGQLEAHNLPPAGGKIPPKKKRAGSESTLVLEPRQTRSKNPSVVTGHNEIEFDNIIE